MKVNTLVIGYGNPLRADDGIGWVAAERLAELNLEGVEVLARQQLTVELAESMSRAERVLFIEGQAGEPDLSLTEVTPSPLDRGRFAHHAEPPLLVGLARRIFGWEGRAALLSVKTESTELGRELTPAAAERLPRVVECASAFARTSFFSIYPKEYNDRKGPYNSKEGEEPNGH